MALLHCALECLPLGSAAQTNAAGAEAQLKDGRPLPQRILEPPSRRARAAAKPGFSACAVVSRRCGRVPGCTRGTHSAAQRSGSVRAAPNGDGTDRTTAALMLSRAFAHARTLITERAVL